MSFIVKVLATNPPMACFALGTLLMLSGQQDSGWTMIWLGAGLQILWLFRGKLK